MPCNSLVHRRQTDRSSDLTFDLIWHFYLKEKSLLFSWRFLNHTINRHPTIATIIITIIIIIVTTTNSPTVESWLSWLRSFLRCLFSLCIILYRTQCDTTCLSTNVSCESKTWKGPYGRWTKWSFTRDVLNALAARLGTLPPDTRIYLFSILFLLSCLYIIIYTKYIYMFHIYLNFLYQHYIFMQISIYYFRYLYLVFFPTVRPKKLLHPQPIHTCPLHLYILGTFLYLSYICI